VGGDGGGRGGWLDMKAGGHTHHNGSQPYPTTIYHKLFCMSKRDDFQKVEVVCGIASSAQNKRFSEKTHGTISA